MSKKNLLALFLCIGTLLLGSALILPGKAQMTPSLTPIEQLGKSLYFDQHLSKNANQSCATCHAAETGYTGADSNVNAHGAVYPGSDPNLFGNRKPPSAAYAGDSPLLHYDNVLLAWVGGMFWDGRADGSVLGDPLAEQAKGPFLNPLEMGIASPEELCSKVKAGAYTNLFEQVWGAASLDCSKAAVVYDQIGKSIAAFERSAEVNPFSSKFDQFWDKAKTSQLDVTRITASNWTSYRNLGLNDQELYGLAIFNDPAQANCASCHSLKPGSKGYPLFTNYSFANPGIPKNLENPFYSNLAYNPAGKAWVDIGLGGYMEKTHPQSAAQTNGLMKVPTLRNVDKRPSADFVKAYGHNGTFKSLADIIRFYSFRSMIGGGMSGMGMMSQNMASSSGTNMAGGMMGMGMMGRGMMGGGMMRGGMMGAQAPVSGSGMGSMMGGCMMGGGMMMFPAPEVNENLASLRMLRCPDQSNILVFLKTLSDGYYQR